MRGAGVAVGLRWLVAECGAEASPGELPHPGIEHGSPEFQADSLLAEPPGNRPDVVKNCSRALLDHWAWASVSARPVLHTHRIIVPILNHKG